MVYIMCSEIGGVLSPAGNRGYVFGNRAYTYFLLLVIGDILSPARNRGHVFWNRGYTFSCP